MELFSDEVRLRERRRRRREPLWSLASVFLHVSIFALVVLLAPVTRLAAPGPKGRPQPSAELTADRLEALAETLSSVRMNELLRQVEAMQAVLHNMDAMREALAKDYDAFAASEAVNARERLERLVAEAAESQAKAVSAQAAVKAEVAGLVKVETEGALTNRAVSADILARREKLLDRTAEQTNTAQGNAVNALDKLEVKAAFAGFKKTSEAAGRLREAQMAAAKLQDAAQTAAADAAAEVAQFADCAARIARLKGEIARNAKSGPARETLDNRLKDALSWQERLEKAKRERATGRQVERLAEAEEAQKALNAEIRLLEATLSADVSQLETLAQGPKRKENALVSERADALTLGEAYALARRLEGAIAVSYKDVKATETAIARKMSFAAAQEMTDVATPARRTADDEALRENVRTQAALDRRKKAEAEVVREVGSMVEATVAMMEDAMRIVMGGGASATAPSSDERAGGVRWLDADDFARRSDETSAEARLAAMNAASDYAVALQAAAAEDAQAKAKDLSGLMAKTDAESARTRRVGELPDAPSLKGGEPGLLPGNVMRLGAGGGDDVPGATWMYVNSWYVIGPFPNPNRVNLRRKFAPESVQDLDATYAGKDGRVLRWRFWQAQSSKPPQPWMPDWRAEVIPEGREEYSIYYAYAEVFFDEACDRWVAIGSDDRSDAWLNDIPIWGSSNRLKAWHLAEDYRRVHFRKGRNRLLVRVENGHWNCGWSFCIATGEGRP